MLMLDDMASYGTYAIYEFYRFLVCRNIRGNVTIYGKIGRRNFVDDVIALSASKNIAYYG